MKEKLTAVLDGKIKKVTWWNRNYFFIATLLVVVVNIALYGARGSRWEQFIGPNYGGWGNLLDFDNLIRAFLNSFSHANWHHVLLNMLCFFVYGAYLERKHGTLYFLLTVVGMTFITSFAVQANYLSVDCHGFSGVNFGFYAYFIVDYIFSFFKGKVGKFNIIAGAVIIALIYLSSCFSGGTSSFTFEWFPYDLITNMGHYSSALAGLILAIIINVSQLIAIKQAKDQATA